MDNLPIPDNQPLKEKQPRDPPSSSGSIAPSSDDSDIIEGGTLRELIAEVERVTLHSVFYICSGRLAIYMRNAPYVLGLSGGRQIKYEEFMDLRFDAAVEFKEMFARQNASRIRRHNGIKIVVRASRTGTTINYTAFNDDYAFYTGKWVPPKEQIVCGQSLQLLEENEDLDSTN